VAAGLQTRRLAFDEIPEARDGQVPLARDLVERLTREREPPRFELPDLLAPLAPTAGEPGVRQRDEMLGDRLAGDVDVRVL